MATTYTLDWSDPSKATITLLPSQTNTSDSSLTLYGENSFLWGEGFNENLMHMLENFAYSSGPSNPVEGQLWYDNSIGMMKVYNGTSWQSVSGTSGTAGDAPASRSTVLWIDGDQIVVPAPALVDVVWDRCEYDPFNLYGGDDTTISTEELRFPTNATKMKCTVTVGVDLGACVASDWMTFAILNQDYETGTPPAYVNYGSRPHEGNGVTILPDGPAWVAGLAVWKNFTTPWIDLEPAPTNPWRMVCVNMTSSPAVVMGTNFGASESRNVGCVVTIEYDFS